jgi:hypothetical protein
VGPEILPVPDPEAHAEGEKEINANAVADRIKCKSNLSGISTILPK